MPTANTSQSEMTNDDDIISNTIDTVSNPVEIPGILGSAYDDEDADRMMRKITQESMQGGEIEEVVIPSSAGCQSLKQYFAGQNLSWVPDCDCEGNFKKVQCSSSKDQRMECWCSTRSGSEVAHSRKTLSCTNPKHL